MTVGQPIHSGFQSNARSPPGKPAAAGVPAGATHMRDLIREAGRTCEVVHGGTHPTERRRIITAYKRGEIWAVTNDNVMSTGTNVPGIDLIVDEAATASAARYVLRVGRGTRVIYPPGFNPDAVDANCAPRCDCVPHQAQLPVHGLRRQPEPARPGRHDRAEGARKR